MSLYTESAYLMRSSQFAVEEKGPQTFDRRTQYRDFFVDQIVLAEDARNFQKLNWSPSKLLGKIGSQICSVRVNEMVWRRHVNQLLPRKWLTTEEMIEARTVMAVVSIGEQNAAPMNDAIKIPLRGDLVNSVTQIESTENAAKEDENVLAEERSSTSSCAAETRPEKWNWVFQPRQRFQKNKRFDMVIAKGAHQNI